MKNINVVNLHLDLENPRFEEQQSQHLAIEKMAKEQGIKLANLADDIASNGLNPSETVIVLEQPDKNNHTVLEGNRRIAAIKLVTEAELTKSLDIPESLKDRFINISKKKNSRLPFSIDCAVVGTRNEAKKWIELRHTGENEGRGIIPWDAVQRRRFEGASPELIIIEKVKESQYLDESTRKKLEKFPITNLERVVNTPEARTLIGIDLKDRKLFVTGNEEEVTARLAIIVSDLANKYIKVSHLDTKQQRIQYARVVVERPLPKPNSKISPSIEPKKRKKKNGNNPNSRTTLIPKDLKLSISEPRIAKIFLELQMLSLDKFVNSCAVLLRVFVEMSIASYGEKHQISFKEVSSNIKRSTRSTHTKDMKLSKKILEVVKHLKNNNKVDINELKGITVIANNRDHILSVDSWNSYVHNKSYHPASSDLKTNWDNISPFIQKIWPKKK